MENINLILFICLMIPMSMMLLLFKGHSRLLCGFLLIGMFVCVFSGEIDGFVANINNMDVQSISINLAPIVEEFAKAFPIIFASFLLKPTKQDIVEFSLATGVGFATLENVCILMESNALSFQYALLRAVGAGMMHGVCALIVGIAMCNIIKRKSLYFCGTLSALSISIIFHSIYNMLITSRFMIIAVLFPSCLFIIFMFVEYILNRKKPKIE